MIVVVKENVIKEDAFVIQDTKVSTVALRFVLINVAIWQEKVIVIWTLINVFANLDIVALIAVWMKIIS